MPWSDGRGQRRALGRHLPERTARQALTETEVPDAITLSRSKVFSFEGAHEATALAPIVAIGDGYWH